MPKVSVLTPVYNTNPVHLQECIESILNQTFTDFEFLILNDSPENTEIDKIVNSYQDSRIKYIKNETNLGISPSRNKLLEMATGEYLAIFDHDDISVPDRLQIQVEYLDTHPYVGVVSGWLELFGSKSEVCKKPEKNLEIKTLMTENCCIAHTATMIRKSVLTENNLKYEEKFSPAEDYRLFARLMELTDFYNIQRVLVKYRWHDGNTTKKVFSKMSEAHDEIQAEICDKHPFLRSCFEKYHAKEYGTRFKIRLFGIIPTIKVKHDTVLLFDAIPLYKIKRK
ncbi:MAG: glycosyltransferase [Alphaproteobacteria bacterium]|nr:glycosyltransferase [Alphaproteobacteria bacterium]